MKITNCKACGAEIVFLPTQNGKANPVNVDSLKPEERNFILAGGELMFIPKSHQMSHFATCPEAKKFRRTEKSE